MNYFHSHHPFLFEEDFLVRIIPLLTTMAPRVVRRKYTLVTKVETIEEYLEVDSSEEDHQDTDHFPDQTVVMPKTQIVPFVPSASTMQQGPRPLEPAEEHHEVIEASLEQSSTINCVLCAFSSTNEPELENHIEENHKEIFNVVIDEVPTESALTEKEKLNCVLCTFTSTNEPEMENHIDESHKDIFTEVQPDSALTAQTQIIEFNCVLCTFSSTNEPELENHIDDKHNDIFKADTPITEAPTKSSAPTKESHQVSDSAKEKNCKKSSKELEKPKSSSTSFKRRHNSDDPESSDPSDLDSDISVSWSSSSDTETENNVTTVRKRCRTDFKKKKSERPTQSKELLSDDDDDIIEVGRVCRKGCDSPYCPFHKK